MGVSEKDSLAVNNTVDGRNPAPVDRYFFPVTIQGDAGFLPSTVGISTIVNTLDIDGY